jgi:hypothetical protein
MIAISTVGPDSLSHIIISPIKRPAYSGYDQHAPKNSTSTVHILCSDRVNGRQQEEGYSDCDVDHGNDVDRHCQPRGKLPWAPVDLYV